MFDSFHEQTNIFKLIYEQIFQHFFSSSNHLTVSTTYHSTLKSFFCVPFREKLFFSQKGTIILQTHVSLFGKKIFFSRKGTIILQTHVSLFGKIFSGLFFNSGVIAWTKYIRVVDQLQPASSCLYMHGKVSIILTTDK